MVSQILKRRDSNMELLRIVTMCMIVLLHLVVFLLEAPEKKLMGIVGLPVLIVKSLVIISVNVFVLLSGWYGIKVKLKRLAELCFQVFFFGVIGILISNYFSDTLSLKKMISYLFLMTGNEYVFFQSYILLYVFSPILNMFAERTDRRTFTIFLMMFFVIQFVWGCLSWGYIYFGNGYSAISFIGVYLLARYIKIYRIEFFPIKKSILYYGVIYLIVSIVGGVAAYFLQKYNLPGYNCVYSYASPVVVFSALMFLLLFSKLSFESRWVNRLSRHCFAVYLFHMNSLILPVLVLFGKNYVISESLFHIVKLFFLAEIVIFTISILLDVLRLAIWDGFCGIFRYKS